MDRPDGKQIARHLRGVIAALPKGIQKIFARADSGFYCCEAVHAYEKAKAHFIIVARKTSRLLERLHTADWKRSPKTDADEQCEFWYQPEGALTLAGLLVTLACTSSTSSNKADQRAAAAACTEPENPYAEGSGHYAGYEWAERNNPGNCGGSSQSFIEGCEEYHRQDEEFEGCESKK
jgi:hypothetical protein